MCEHVCIVYAYMCTVTECAVYAYMCNCHATHMPACLPVSDPAVEGNWNCKFQEISEQFLVWGRVYQGGPWREDEEEGGNRGKKGGSGGGWGNQGQEGKTGGTRDK